MNKVCKIILGWVLLGALTCGVHSYMSSSRSLFMGIKSALRYVFRRDRNLGVLADADIALKRGIANFYDESSSIWLDVWGENMHHGYYPTKNYKDHKLAQVDMIDRALSWGYGDDWKGDDTPIRNVIDVGCGVGGSSRHMSKRFGCSGKGVSLSNFQIETAKEFTRKANLTDKMEYMVADALNMPFDDMTFDLAWSMESGEHMPDKKRFLQEMTRVLKPNGRIVIATWCHREIDGNGNAGPLTRKENKLLNKISDSYFLPAWCPASYYIQLAQELGLEDIRTDDWSEYVEPFWPAVIQSALVPRNFFNLLRAGKTTIKGALATLYMRRGFTKGIIKFAMITAKVPAAKV